MCALLPDRYGDSCFFSHTGGNWENVTGDHAEDNWEQDEDAWYPDAAYPAAGDWEEDEDAWYPDADANWWEQADHNAYVVDS